MADDLPPLQEVASSLEDALRETNHDRPLDSLETVVVRSYFAGQGVDAADTFSPEPNTLRQWLRWAERFSRSV